MRLVTRYKHLAAGGGLLSLALLMAACYPIDGDLDTEDFDVVTTLYDEGVDFTGFGTYAMPDSVVHLEDPDNPSDDITREYDDLILNEVAQQMEALGYQRILDPDAEAPDVVVLAGITTSEFIGYAGYPGYWWDWWYGWGWYPCCYGGGYYPWYPPGYAYTYSTGTVLVDIIDPARTDQEDRVASIWLGALNGLAGRGGEATRIRQGIQQAFQQSPYLRTN